MSEFEKEILDMFPDIVDVLIVGDSVLARCEDGDWTAKRDSLDVDSQWYQATGRQSELIDRSLFTEEEAFDDRLAQEVLDKYTATNPAMHQSDVELEQMKDHTGSQQNYLDQYFGNAFEPDYRFGFSL